MNRRSALKTIGLALLAPVVKLRQSVDRERLLRAFCADWTSVRFDLEHPFNFGSLTYASDYRHAVRAELLNTVEDGERRIPNMDQVWEKYWHPTMFRPFELPAPDSPLLLAPEKGYWGMCPLCDDRRLPFGDSYPASWDEAESLKDYDADDNTYRDPSCPMCQGNTWRGPCELMVEGVRMQYSRLKPVAALPGLRVAGNLRQESTEGPLVFIADGFEGLAMGLVK